MKIALIMIILLSGSVFAQNPIKKGYAFQRSTLSGTTPRKVLEESGKQVERRVKSNNSYFIYLEVNRNSTVEASKIWIKGKPFTLKSHEVAAPVIINYEQPGRNSDTLVKETKNKIIRVQPDTELHDVPDFKLSNNDIASAIVIEYRINSKTHYYTIKEIKKLPPLVLQ